MVTAVDTNILLDILRPNAGFLGVSLAALERSAEEGGVVVCEIVYSELSAQFADRDTMESFLDDFSIRFDSMGRSVCHYAGQAWKRYRDAGGTRNRILPDFLIGAHALHQASRLLTRDRGFYRTYFGELRIVPEDF